MAGPLQLISTVEAVDPIILGMKLVDGCENNGCCCCCDPNDIPTCITSCFPGELSMSSEGKRVYVTLGQFSMIRLERDSQLLIPAYSGTVDYQYAKPAAPDEDGGEGVG